MKIQFVPRSKHPVTFTTRQAIFVERNIQTRSRIIFALEKQ
jgi:hypothetical protein